MAVHSLSVRSTSGVDSFTIAGVTGWLLKGWRAEKVGQVWQCYPQIDRDLRDTAVANPYSDDEGIYEMSLPRVSSLQDEWTIRWHDEAIEAWQTPGDFLESLIARQHLANFELWHTEDEARAPEVSDTGLARVKRRIDEINQRRNDLTEQLDRTLLGLLQAQSLPNSSAQLHSESPGLIIDRLSILALKIFHTREEMLRHHAPPDHAERNRGRLFILEEQRDDLDWCLHQLWAETLLGRKRFKMYRQLKMYNDPTLNPAVYRRGSHFKV